MKANEVPERLYFGESDKGVLDIYSNRESNDEVEYTRTDAFIEKAAEWLFNQANYYTKLKIDAHNGGVCADFYADKMVEDFRKYMEGE